jgi:HNH endonuclease
MQGGVMAELINEFVTWLMNQDDEFVAHIMNEDIVAKVRSNIPKFVDSKGERWFLHWPRLWEQPMAYRRGFCHGLEDAHALQTACKDNGLFEITFDRLFLTAIHAEDTHGTKTTITRKLRFEILKRDGYRCQICGAAATDNSNVRLQVDHKRAQSNNGTNHPDNLWTLCADCNIGKGNDAL